MQTDKDETLYSDVRDEDEDGVYSREDTEAENAILKQKSIKKMKDVHASVNKGPKISKEKPKPSIQKVQKVTKIKDSKKIKAEKPAGLPGRSKSKLRNHDAAINQSKDDPTNGNEDDLYDDGPNSNVGVHNMSISISPGSEKSMDVAEVLDEAVETKGYEVGKVKGLEKQVRHENPKDKLITTESGDIVRRENYVIPKKQR